MTTKQIDYCIELAHTLNFSRAAENTFVSQPTFSYQLKLLEDEVGFKIQAIYFLPEAIRIFENEQPGVQVTPLFQYDNGVESF